MATSAAAAVQDEPATRFAKDQLKAIIERIERLEEEKKTIADDIRDVYAEAKGNGFDVKALRTIVRMRKQDAERAGGAGDDPGDLHAGAGNAVRRRLRVAGWSEAKSGALRSTAHRIADRAASETVQAVDDVLSETVNLSAARRCAARTTASAVAQSPIP